MLRDENLFWNKGYGIAVILSNVDIYNAQLATFSMSLTVRNGIVIVPSKYNVFLVSVLGWKNDHNQHRQHLDRNQLIGWQAMRVLREPVNCRASRGETTHDGREWRTLRRQRRILHHCTRKVELVKMKRGVFGKDICFFLYSVIRTLSRWNLPLCWFWAVRWLQSKYNTYNSGHTSRFITWEMNSSCVERH